MIISEVETAWIAGILEGEGSFIARGKSPVVQLSMTDEDVIRRVHAFAGVGTVVGPYEYRGFKPQWKFHVTRAEDAVALMRRVLPFMLKRRAAKIETLIHDWEIWKDHGLTDSYMAKRIVDEETRVEIRSRKSSDRGILTQLSHEYGVSRATIKKIWEGR